MVIDIKLFVAMKAFVIHKGKVLIVREAQSYKYGTNAGRYEIVGGRIEPGEWWHEALKREVVEEAGLEIEIGEPFAVGEWRPVVRDEQWQIVATYFECHADSNAVTLSDDHDAYEWIDPKEYKKYNLMENLYPVFETYLKRKGVQ